jgi:hypothetical protein
MTVVIALMFLTVPLIMVVVERYKKWRIQRVLRHLEFIKKKEIKDYVLRMRNERRKLSL